jgi:S1-C subfamily serine protease
MKEILPEPPQSAPFFNGKVFRNAAITIGAITPLPSGAPSPAQRHNARCAAQPALLLRPGMLLVAVNGRSVASRAGVQQWLATLADGDPVQFTVIRTGSIVECALGPKPAAARKP